MDILKMLWPTPFMISEKDVVSFVVQLVIFFVICAIVGFLMGILAWIPILGLLFALVGALVEFYGLVGIILCVLKFLGLVK